MARRTSTKAKTSTTTSTARNISDIMAEHWNRLPASQQRTIRATVLGILAFVILLGTFPGARQTWVADVASPVQLLLDWGAPPTLLVIIYTCGLLIAEPLVNRVLLRPAWLWCGAVALFVLLAESRLLLGEPVGGLLGALGAWMLRLLPDIAAQVLVLGILLVDALIAFRISWNHVQRVTSALTRKRASKQAEDNNSAPQIAIDEHALPPLPHLSAAHIVAVSGKRTTHTLSQSIPSLDSADSAEISLPSITDPLDIPAYLRRMAAKEVDVPKQATTTEQVGPALPPLPPRKLSAASSDAQPDQSTARRPSMPVVQPTSQPKHTRLSLVPPSWKLPPLHLMNLPAEQRGHDVKIEVERMAQTLERALKGFDVAAEVRRSDISIGPTIIRFGIRPLERIRTDERGRALVDDKGEPLITRTRVSRIMNLKSDLALALSAKSLRMEAPVPERPYVGIEIPNVFGRMVTLREILESKEYQALATRNKLAIALGRDVAGRIRIGDMARFPHVLIAGATGAGKSVCLNTMICSLITHAKPDEVRLVMVDPKMVELMQYEGIPHLLTPVITDPQQVVGALNAAIKEMSRRLKLFSSLGVRNLDGYNELRQKTPDKAKELLPRIIIIIDELADLMMVAADEVERQICRLAQLSRATGMHLVVATQRPSVDVITGLIKANIPTRIAFMVSSAVDSRTILDGGGAEHLLGRGDMLFLASDAPRAERIQGAFVADDEVERLVRFWRLQAQAAGNAVTRWDIDLDDSEVPLTDGIEEL
jgi:FtsK/SpoIIIE family/FtsK alpha domain